MPNIFKVTKRAQEIVRDRTLRWYEDLQYQASVGASDQSGDALQREKAAAYEAVTMERDPVRFMMGMQQFTAQYGEEEWQRQGHLALQRRAKMAGG